MSLGVKNMPFGMSTLLRKEGSPVLVQLASVHHGQQAGISLALAKSSLSSFRAGGKQGMG